MTVLKPRSFQAKLLLFMTAGLVLLQAATLIAIHVAGRRSLQQTVSEELKTAFRVFERSLESRGRQVSDTARILAADYAFREVVATGDTPTIRSALANHGARVDADHVFLISLDGRVDATTRSGRYARQGFPIPMLLDRARSEDGAFGVVSFEGRPFEFVVVPVLAPQPIAYIALGYSLDGAALEEVSSLTATELSIWDTAEGSEPVLVSTLDKDKLGALRDHLHALEPANPSVADTIRLGSESYGTLLAPLETSDGTRIYLLLKRSMEDAWKPFRLLELQIFALSSLAWLGALAAALFLAGSVSRPLKRLAEVAQNIEHGNYSALVDIDQPDEIGQLASALDDMRVGIAAREAKILYQATYDSLTDLPNRALFLDRFAHAISQAKRTDTQVGMLMMDLDRFMEVNDTLGHELGDELLRQVARRLRRTMRESDTVARLGGDEFAVLVESTDMSGCVDVSNRIRTALEAFFSLDGVSVAVNGSIGVSIYPLHGKDAPALMKCADVAMYDAKKNQLQTAVYEPERDDHSVRRLAILADLSNAVDRDELELHYQPKVDIDSRRAVHVEALIRWRHPKLGMIPPDEFIPQAERSGKIRMITDWVLNRAIHDCADWNGAGLDLTVALNLSALDLHDTKLSSVVRSRLDEAGLPPEKLVLEVTESAVMRDEGRAADVLGKLQALGVVIAIDDFGTGYSSLSQLRRLPVGELKIDRSFVTNLGEESSDDVVIVRSTIELGHNLGLKVVAEGVESAEGWETLRRLGCDMAQGYFISRPLPAEQLTAWMLESSWGVEGSRSGRIA